MRFWSSSQEKFQTVRIHYTQCTGLCSCGLCILAWSFTWFKQKPNTKYTNRQSKPTKPHKCRKQYPPNPYNTHINTRLKSCAQTVRHRTHSSARGCPHVTPKRKSVFCFFYISLPFNTKFINTHINTYTTLICLFLRVSLSFFYSLAKSSSQERIISLK